MLKDALEKNIKKYKKSNQKLKEKVKLNDDWILFCEKELKELNKKPQNISDNILNDIINEYITRGIIQ